MNEHDRCQPIVRVGEINPRKDIGQLGEPAIDVTTEVDQPVTEANSGNASSIANDDVMFP